MRSATFISRAGRSAEALGPVMAPALAIGNRPAMKLLHLDCPTEFKTIGEAGRFEGYAAIFGNVDLGGDVIERGAFKEIVKGRNGMVKVLYQHNTKDPIGVANVAQDDTGLRFDGQLILDSVSARSAHALMK